MTAIKKGTMPGESGATVDLLCHASWRREMAKHLSNLALHCYYLRAVEHYQSRPEITGHPHASTRVMVVEHMDRARGHTVDIFTQTHRGTIHTTAKLTLFPLIAKAE